jgi:transcriptional regulator of acetoin/glycerol metabolism
VSLDEEIGNLERDRLRQALITSGGNKAEAARLLGLPRSTFFSKLRKLGIE